LEELEGEVRRPSVEEGAYLPPHALVWVVEEVACPLALGGEMVSR